MPSSASLAETAKALVGFGVATVHEALGRRGLARGLRLLVGGPFAGPAITVALPAGDNLGIHALLSGAAPGAVACVASEGKGTFGVFGDLLALVARERGLAGLIIDDGIRDASTLHAPSIAARGIAAAGTQKRRFLSIHEPIALGSVLIGPGDWIVCDGDGVCVVPTAQLEGLLAAAAARTTKEEGLRVELGRGRTTVDVLGLTRLIEKGAARQ
jgi:4-hydroxy-4-methyl-2-oxoglutarate aldolase